MTVIETESIVDCVQGQDGSDGKNGLPGTSGPPVKNPVDQIHIDKLSLSLLPILPSPTKHTHTHPSPSPCHSLTCRDQQEAKEHQDHLESRGQEETPGQLVETEREENQEQRDQQETPVHQEHLAYLLAPP